MVKRLAVVELIPVAASIRSSNGPTAAMAGRRFSARAKMTTVSRKVAPRSASSGAFCMVGV